MSSLRARLLVALVVLTAVGMLLLAAITYAEQRSFLIARTDQQARSAVGAVAGALGERGIGDGGHEHDHRGDGGPGRGPAFGLPPGTYGQARDATGRVLGGAPLTFGATGTTAPAIPSRLPLDRFVTVSARPGDGARYRVLETAAPGGGGFTVVAVPLREVDQTLSRLLLVESLVVAAVLLVLGAAAWAIVRIGLLPLDRMGATAGAIAAGDLSQRVEPATPRSEVGRLGMALNAMLDRLEEAFAARTASENRLRRFIADASHELRTPLASIRGYAELFRMGAASEPADVAKAMRRIEDEAARMGVLVEDLLTLARLDRLVDAPHAPVDLETLVRDTVDDARVTAPDRAIALDVQGPVTVSGDADQLRQVLANLVRNALVHTPAGTPVEVCAAADGDEVRLEVRDHGRGLPVTDPRELFERFWRAEAGRERGKGGAGLGLAIVAGIVDAHGGRVEASDAPGGGAAFVVHLPRA
jgi:two-component system OmpR family sensor kinase